MKILNLIFSLLLLSSFAFGQGAVVPPQNALKAVNGILMPIAGATITVCGANASGTPCGPALTNTIFRDAALTQPLSNPFTADSNGNYNFAVAPGTYTVTVTASGFAGYSYQITVQCPASNNCTWTGPVNFNGGTLNGSYGGNPTFTGTVTFSGNPLFSGNPIFSGNAVVTGSLLPSGTGQLVATGQYITSTGTTAPSPLAASACPTGQGVWKYIKKSDGNYQDVASLDVSTVTPPTSPAGTINNCWRTWWNDSGAAMSGMKNRLVAILHVAGNGGIDSAAGANDESALGIVMQNTGTEQTFRQFLTQYNEAQLSGTPTFAGSAGGEDNAATIRANFTDSRTGGTAIAKIAAVHGIMFINSTTVPVSSCANGNCWIGVQGSVYDLLGGARGSAFYEAIRADGSNSGGCTACGFLGVHVAVPAARFPNGTIGINVDNFGTNAADYAMELGGVNAAGTAAGFWSATGPAVFGAQAHAASGNQLEVRSGFLSLLRTRFSQATNLVSGDFVLSAGWGNTATVSAISGKDSAFTVTVSSSGTGQAANPTFTLTWKDGAWANAPFATCTQTGGTGVIAFVTATPGTTTLIGTWQGTPVAGSTYAVTCHTLAGT